MPYKNKADHNAQNRRWREEHPEEALAIHARSRAKHGEAMALRAREMRANPENAKKMSAESKIRGAVRHGWLIRPEGKTFHHPDYDRPYYGTWVTAREHRRIHAGLIECPPCFDYVERIAELSAAAIKAGDRKGAEATNRLRWG